MSCHQKIRFFDAKLRFALSTPSYYINDELKRSEVNTEKSEETKERSEELKAGENLEALLRVFVFV